MQFSTSRYTHGLLSCGVKLVFTRQLFKKQSITHLKAIKLLQHYRFKSLNSQKLFRNLMYRSLAKSHCRLTYRCLFSADCHRQKSREYRAVSTSHFLDVTVQNNSISCQLSVNIKNHDLMIGFRKFVDFI